MFQRRLSHIVSLCIVIFLVQNVLAENWPQFRGPGGLGISQEKGLLVQSDCVRWQIVCYLLQRIWHGKQIRSHGGLNTSYGVC